VVDTDLCFRSILTLSMGSKCNKANDLRQLGLSSKFLSTCCFIGKFFNVLHRFGSKISSQPKKLCKTDF